MTATTATNKTAASTKEVNYTPEQTANMVRDYLAAPTKDTVEKIAVALGKTARSVVAKLSREKVYVKPAYVTKTGEAVQKKDETADAIGAVLRMSEPEIESLTKANKTALQKILVALYTSKPIEGMDDREQKSMARVSADALNSVDVGLTAAAEGIGFDKAFQRGEPFAAT